MTARPGRNRHRAHAQRSRSIFGDRPVNETSSAKVVAGSLGLAAFAIALLAGLGSGADADLVLGRAVISMFVCFLIGYVIGLVGERAMNEAAQRYRDENPIDESATATSNDAMRAPAGAQRAAMTEPAS